MKKPLKTAIFSSTEAFLAVFHTKYYPQTTHLYYFQYFGIISNRFAARIIAV